MRKKILLFVIPLIIISIFVMNKFDIININKTQSVTDNIDADTDDKIQGAIYTKDYISQPHLDRTPYKEKVKVKGIYLTGNTVGYNPRFTKLMDLVNTTELNAMVIDVKDDKGILTYKSYVDMAEEIGANEIIKAKNFDEKMKQVIDNDVYPIARIVTFKDRLAGSKRPDLTIKSKNGSVWKDNNGNAWLNPYNKASWEYPIKLAEEAALKGFKEIQFDYVRFPTDGNRALIDYGQAAKNKSKEEVIAEFLLYARERLEPMGVYVSADVFGLVTTVKGDMDIGQHLETLTTSTDILCPMVYPSHYALGSYGVPYPDTNPYKIVNTSMSRAKERIDKIDADGRKAILRPWLQDFSAPWLKRDYGKHYVTYGPEQVRAQIKATYDAGLEEWILWSASNRYTEGALLKE